MNEQPSVAEPRSVIGEVSCVVPAPCAGAYRDAPAGVRRLTLAHFRSYTALDIFVGAHLVVLTGENGAGKTNLLEALSLFTPGRGLRGAELGECARGDGSGGFAISVEVETQNGAVQLGTGLTPQKDAPAERRFRVNREPAASIRDFCGHVRILWLTPAMDGLFIGPAGDRRRFLDRLVLAIDAAHAHRVNAYERALRSRNRLLEEGPGADRKWLDAIEHEAAGLAVAISAARIDTVSRLAALITETRSEIPVFPWADLALEGDVERLVAGCPAIQAEEAFRAILRDNRPRDAAAGRALSGPQRSDLCVRHGPKQVPAGRASTGEQKALLAGLVLAHARLVAAVTGIAPVVLLDEVAAHFDQARRDALFEVIKGLSGQIWLSGTDRAAFSAIENEALMLTVVPGAVTSASRGQIASLLETDRG